jgi:AraC family transcriptional regulator
MQIVRRTLFDSDLLRVNHVLARPSSSECGAIECQHFNILVLPLAGVFAKHDGPRRHVIATPNHAVFIAAGSPYRISYPGGIGDEALTLWFSTVALARGLPEIMSQNGLGSSGYASHTLLPPALMLARSLLWQRFRRGGWDPLEVEELSVGLVLSTLQAARKDGAHRSPHVPPVRASRRLQQVEHVKEAISLCPERKWTLGDLADLASVSPYHLAHVFREAVGASVYRYVLRSRLAKALDAVLDTDTDLTTIALETGFSSHSHFTARFRALFGLTPVELRRGASCRVTSELRKIVIARAPAAP